jgi:hypothetical protein
MTTPALGLIFGQILLAPQETNKKVTFLPKLNTLGKDLIEAIGVTVRMGISALSHCSLVGGTTKERRSYCRRGSSCSCCRHSNNCRVISKGKLLMKTPQ